MNFLVFMGDKVYNYRISNEGIGIAEACIYILTKPKTANLTISHLSIVVDTGINSIEHAIFTSENYEMKVSAEAES